MEWPIVAAELVLRTAHTTRLTVRTEVAVVSKFLQYFKPGLAR
jgi:hypothetical protein